MHIFIETIGAEIPSGLHTGIDVTSTLIEAWCTHELQWAVYERKTPLVWGKSPDTYIRGALSILTKFD